jgi:hypothetical protein
MTLLRTYAANKRQRQKSETLLDSSVVWEQLAMRPSPVVVVGGWVGGHCGWQVLDCWAPGAVTDWSSHGTKVGALLGGVDARVLRV